MSHPAPNGFNPPEAPLDADNPASDTLLPFLLRYPILAGALVGIALRLMFSGHAGSNWSAMAGAFIYFAPVAIGAVTVYLAERQYRRSWAYYFYAPFLATALFV